MPEKNNSALCGALGLGTQGKRQECPTCIDCDKIYDSCRDKDCLEDLKVHLTECGQEIIDHATNIRCKSAEILSVNISVDPIPFNNGYYSVCTRFYFKLVFEACVNGKLREFCGLAIYDKKCVLFGSDGNVKIYTSESCNNNFCHEHEGLPCDCKTNLPKAVVEVVPPVCLGVKLVEKQYKFGCCCCNCEQIPEKICKCFSECFTDDYGTKNLYVSLGLFTVTRLERPVSLVICAADFCIPEKESSTAGTDTNDPCELFKKMNFPLDDFFPPAQNGKCFVDKDRCC